MHRAVCVSVCAGGEVARAHAQRGDGFIRHRKIWIRRVKSAAAVATTTCPESTDDANSRFPMIGRHLGMTDGNLLKTMEKTTTDNGDDAVEANLTCTSFYVWNCTAPNLRVHCTHRGDDFFCQTAYLCECFYSNWLQVFRSERASVWSHHFRAIEIRLE